MANACIHAGKRWVGQLVEALKKEYQETVTLTRWDWKAYGAMYLLRLDVDDQYDVGAQVQGFTRSQMRECGNPDSAYDGVRDEMERTIRWQFALLARQQQP